MRVLDNDGNEITDVDTGAGKLTPDRVLTAHHEATDAVPEASHEEVIWQDPDNPESRIVRKVVDSPYQAAVGAWDEYEDVMRFVPYTDDELAEIEARREADAAAAAEEAERKQQMAELPSIVEEQDLAIAALYESQIQMQLETDEAIAALYESTLGA